MRRKKGIIGIVGKEWVIGQNPVEHHFLIGLGEEQWPSTTAAIERLERKLEMKEHRKGY